MDWSAFELPEGRWELSGPESQVLLTGLETPDKTALKIAIFELLLKRNLALVEARARHLYFFRKTINVLVLKRASGAGTPKALTSVLERFWNERTFVDGTRGLSIKDVALRMMSSPGPRRPVKRSYVEMDVLASLVDRRLFAHSLGFVAGSSLHDRWPITESGKARHAELLRILEIGSGPFKEWVQHDPARARAFVDRAGSSLLLLGGMSEAMGLLLAQSNATDLLASTAELLPESERTQRRQDEDSSSDSGGFGFGWYPLVLADWGSQDGRGALDQIGDSFDAAWDNVSDAVDDAWDAIDSAGDGDGE